MKKVFKKSLACVLALMLCLTAMVGAMSVSAAVSDVSVSYATYFSNDTRAYQVCPGTNVRAQVTVSGITAGAAYGIKVDIPANVEITEFSKFGTAAFDESSITTYYNEELGLYTILATATVDGAQTFCIEYNVTDATTKKVHILNCEVEAAESSSSKLYTAKAFETGNGNAYYEVKAHEAAEAVTENVVAATCTTAGSHDEVVYCKWGLHEEISRETVVDPAKGHTDGTPVVENNVPATCEAEGGYDTVVYCSVCNAELSRVHTTLEPLGHDYVYTVNGDGTHTGTCQNDAEHTVTEAHNFVDGTCNLCGATESHECEHANLTFVSATPATSKTTGSIVFHCADCDKDVPYEVNYATNSNLTSMPGIECASTTMMKVKYNKGTNGSPVRGFMVYTHNYGDGVTPAKIDNYEVTSENESTYLSGNYYEFRITTFYNHFTDIFDCTFYTLRSDGLWYNGGTRNFSIQNVGMKYMATGDEGTKYAVANLLKAGAAVQTEYGYATDNLADSQLDAYSSYVINEVPSITRTAGANYYQLPSGYQTAGLATYATPGVVLGESVAVKLRVNPTYYSGGKEGLDNLRLHYSYTTENGYAVEGDISDYEWNASDRAEFTIGVNAPDMRSVITFTLYNGDQVVAEDAVYSIEGALAYYRDRNQYVNVIERVMIYSDVVAMYF